jgi:hypothetical protein
MRRGLDHAGFAAATGLSDEVLRWTVDASSSLGARSSALTPSTADPLEAERWDLDPAADPPDEADLTAGVLGRASVEWVEAGTTLEVIVGSHGWLAVRRRQRFWAQSAEQPPRLIAQRGFTAWERALEKLDQEDPHPAGSGAGTGDLGVLVLTPIAATSVVTALVDEFHGPTSHRAKRMGAGWDLVDDPVRPDGLAGGSFDDAGFPAGSRRLARQGVWLGRLGGPGTLRRASFREPPMESPSNLALPPGEDAGIPKLAMVARRCRVIKPSVDLWVLELGSTDSSSRSGLRRTWISVSPTRLLESCSSRLGRSTVTATGPIVPALGFEGLLRN